MIRSNPITITCDPKQYFSFPDVVLTPQGEYLCIYRQAPQHHPVVSTIILRSSKDGINWDSVDTLTASIARHGFVFNCPRLGIVDDHLYLLCDIKTSPIEGHATWGIYFWPISNSLEILDPIDLKIQGMVPDHIVKFNNEWLLGYHIHEDKRLVQMVAHSTDGVHWRDRTTIAANNVLHLCEGSIINQNDKLICFMRDNANPEAVSHLSFSEDGKHWSRLHPIPIAAHRIVAGIKQYFPRKNSVIGTYRDTLNRSINIFIMSDNNWETHTIIDEKKTGLYDFGYTGWVENEDGSLLVIYYICGNDPNPKICAMRLEFPAESSRDV